MSRVAVVLSVGGTSGGAQFALQAVLEKEKLNPDVYLVYGEPFLGQQPPTPHDAVTALRNAFPAIIVAEKSVNGTSFEDTYSRITAVLTAVVERNYDRVYLGITGGTNVMVGALFHAGLERLHGEVIPLYVQGKGAQSLDFVTSVRTREAVTVDRVLKLARTTQLPIAAYLVKDLPATGRAGFVRDAITAFSAWDDFRYEVADQFTTLSARNADFADDPSLAAMCETIERYAKFAARLKEFESIVSDPERFYLESVKQNWKSEAVRASWLAIDALANAGRRSREGRYTDAVLRAYRCVEIAVQNRLFRLGVHPSCLDWGKEPLASIANQWSDRPNHIAFEQAVEVLEMLTQERFNKSDRDKLQQIRNTSYLEHGYQRITEKKCAGALDIARQLCSQFLGPQVPIDEKVKQLQFIF